MSAFAARLLPARPDLAAAYLEGRVSAERFVDGRPHRVATPLLDLTVDRRPGGELATQLLHGESFIVYEIGDDGLAWGQSELDGYVGYVDSSGLGAPFAGGRRVTALWSQVYERPHIRARTGAELPFLAEVPVSGSTGAFMRLRGGWNVPRAHFAPIAGDYVAQAERFLGLPYLWGGRSARGIDCSGLVQLALLACGKSAPRDSDMQAERIGRALGAGTALRRGDLVFWKGHVGIMRDGETLLHANAHHMAVASEPLATTADRIAAAGGGPVLIRRRP